MPTMVVSAGTGSTTTAFDPMRALSPTVIGSEHLRAGADDDIVADRRMALAATGTPGDPERDLMIEMAIVADLGGLADDHAHAVVDHKPATNSGRGMNFNSGEESGRDERRNVTSRRRLCVHNACES